jgi:hypothetical protein
MMLLPVCISKARTLQGVYCTKCVRIIIGCGRDCNFIIIGGSELIMSLRTSMRALLLYWSGVYLANTQQHWHIQSVSRNYVIILELISEVSSSIIYSIISDYTVGITTDQLRKFTLVDKINPLIFTTNSISRSCIILS